MQKLNTTLVYILSIVGFVCCCWFAGIAIIPTGIAFMIATKELKKYESNPSEYMNGEAMKTAKTVAMVIFIISALYFVYSIYSIATTPWDEFMSQYEEQMRNSGVEF
jgi:TRAP-type C4-dicarboxylate transport system permease small subunit